MSKNKTLGVSKYIRRFMPLFDAAFVLIAAFIALWIKNNSFEVGFVSLLWMLGNIAVGIGALALVRLTLLAA